MKAVSQIVGIHDRPYMCFFHGALERGQINLAHSPLINDRVGVVTQELLVVSHKMLDGRAHTLALQAVDISDRRSRRQKRVFSEVFKITATHWSTIDVDSWPEHEMHATGASILPYNCTQSLHQFGVPGCGKPNSPKGRGRPIISDPNGSIGHPQATQSNLLDVADVEIIDSTDKVDLLLQG